MGISIHHGTMPGGVTPTCSDCGIALCWDISKEDYHEAATFWDEWICEDCNGGTPLSLKQWMISNKCSTQQSSNGVEN